MQPHRLSVLLSSALTLSLCLLLSATAAAYPRQWSVGGRLSGMGLGISEHDESSHTGYGGPGVLLRHRWTRHLGFELGVDLLTGDMDDGTERSLFHTSGSGMLYLFPGGLLELYGIAGFGTMLVQWRDPELDLDYGEGAAVTLNVGGGLQLLLDRLRLFAELRVLGVAPINRGEGSGEPPETPFLRKPESGRVRAAEDSEIPDGLGGAVFSLGACYVW